ncbi:MAG: hypothetical protein WCD79_08215, partial [Chthoniobacteraceae bacterium]
KVYRQGREGRKGEDAGCWVFLRLICLDWVGFFWVSESNVVSLRLASILQDGSFGGMVFRGGRSSPTAVAVMALPSAKFSPAVSR